jgi:hypothetical protein
MIMMSIPNASKSTQINLNWPLAIINLFGNTWTTRDNDEFGGNGMQIRMVGRARMILCFTISKCQESWAKEMFDKIHCCGQYRKLKWKLTGEAQTILSPLPEKAHKILANECRWQWIMAKWKKSHWYKHGRGVVLLWHACTGRTRGPGTTTG